VDLMPTILDAAGVHGRAPKSATSQRFDGSVDPAERSLLPDLQAGRDTWRRPVVLQNIAMTALELFDMSADPGETVNLATAPEHRGTVRDLAGQLLAWGEEEGDALAVELGARTLAAAERGS
jgi:arylsulfatase A-like enzyme